MAFSLALAFWPPSINHYWLRNRTGGVHISRDGDMFRFRVLCAVRTLRKAGKFPLQPLESNLGVEIKMCPPDRRKRDIDNTLKATLDALTHANVWVDDSQIKRLTLTMAKEPVRGGFFTVDIMELNDEQANA